MREPKTILMTTDAVGGVWRYSLDLAEGLADCGVQLALVVLGPAPSVEQRAQALRLRNVSLFELSGSLEWMDDPWDDVEAAGRFLLQLARRVEPDVLHLNGYCHADLQFDAPKLVVGHSCVLSWWLAVEGCPAPPRYDVYRARVRRGLAAADLVVAPSGPMLRSLQELYGPLPRSRVIPNGRDHASLTTPEKEPFVLCAARLWDRGKNAETLAAAAAGLRWPVYLAGAAERPFGHVDHLGWLADPELTSWYRRASIYALPARYEPFGLSVLEAALQGCALVLGDIPSLREVWGDAALYVPPNDSACLRAVLASLIDDDERRRGLGRRAFWRARAFDRSAMTRGYLSAYTSMLSKHDEGPRPARGAA